MTGGGWRPEPPVAGSSGWLRSLADGLITIVVAPDCPACHLPLERPSQQTVCGGCWSNVRRLTPPLCDACGEPLPPWRELSQRSGRCPLCRRMPRTLDAIRSAGEYAGALRNIVHAFKYGRMRSIAGPLAALMRAEGSAVLADADAVVPVPLHPARRRERGFNQAADLASRLGPPVADVLRRVRRTAPQAGLRAAARRANVRGAFSARRAACAAVAGRTVVLVDDVWTTGATLESCAAVLRLTGATRVRAITAGRVIRRPLS